MASIAGSHFDATASTTVNVVETWDGTNLPPPVAEEFNLEIWTGAAPVPTSPAPGYQGLALLDPGGASITLVSGEFRVGDTVVGAGGSLDMLTANGDNETIQGAPLPVIDDDNPLRSFAAIRGIGQIFFVNGDNDDAIGGGEDLIFVNGDHDMVNAVGDDLIQMNSGNVSVNGGSGNDTILAYGGSNDDTVCGQTGSDTTLLWGANELVDGGSGSDTIMAFAGSTNDTVDAATGDQDVLLFDANDTVNGGSGSDTVGLYSSHETFSGQTGQYSIVATGNNETIDGGSGTGMIGAFGNNDAITAGAGGADSITAVGNSDTISAATTANAAGTMIAIYGDNTVLNLGNMDAVSIGGSQNTVNAGLHAGNQDNSSVNLLYGAQTFVDNGQQFADTVVGFSQVEGDRIHLTHGDTVCTAQSTNNGQDTLVTLSDSSTIRLVGISHFDVNFLS